MSFSDSESSSHGGSGEYKFFRQTCRGLVQHFRRRLWESTGDAMEGNKGKVCVTGGTGFIASWTIKRLLENGYSVSTTIRPDPENKRDMSFLKNLPGASEKLRIFEADLSDPDSFNEAIEECTGVFHVATPVDFENKEPEEVVVRRTIDGALGILKACLKSKTIKRIVYTSSVAAVVVNGKEEDIMDESYWTDVDYVKSVIKYGRSYFISKTLTEKAVLEFAEEHGLDLVTVLPPYVVGPFICPKLPGSVWTTLALILGEQSQYPALLNIGMVHVDDVSRTHMFLLETPNVKGRYNCSSHTLTIQEMASFLSAKYPEFPIPTIEFLKEIKGPKFPFVSSKKLLDAGFKFEYGLDDMFEDAIKCCKEKGYL